MLSARLSRISFSSCWKVTSLPTIPVAPTYTNSSYIHLNRLQCSQNSLRAFSRLLPPTFKTWMKTGNGMRPMLQAGPAVMSRVPIMPTFIQLSSRKFSISNRLALKVSKILKSETKSWRLTAESLSEKAQHAVGWWLIGCCGMVWGAVLIGGITRLTESGLSMVNWHLFKGMKFPRNQQEWDAAFAQYKEYPEFQQREEMTMEEFRFIFKMEYAHRMWGRLVGLAFILPAILFWHKGWITRAMKPRVLILTALVASQGLLGWYMVRSGLEDKTDLHEVVRVSPYRLAAHLGAAFLLYTLTLWSGLSHLLKPHASLDITEPKVKLLRRLAHPAKALVFIAAISGAFVAGLDAGLVYNTFPKMADRWIPSDLWALQPKWRNFFENSTTAQFNHRLLGTGSLVFITAIWWMSRSMPLPRRTRLAVNCLTAAIMLQVSLGIATLLMQVPTSLAASHQSNALLTVSTAVWLTHELRRIPK